MGLYNIAEDYSENTDLAAKYPDKLKELQKLFMSEAKKYQVLPLDNSILARILAPRPSATAGRTEFTYTKEVLRPARGQRAEYRRKILLHHGRRGNPGGRCRGRTQYVRRDDSAATVFTCSRASRYSPTTSSVSNASAGKDRKRSPRANTPSCLTSNMTAPAWPRAGLVFCSWMGRKSPEDHAAHHPGHHDD